MIPVGDNVRSRTFPYVNIAIILLNALIFFYELTISTTPDRFLGGLPALGPLSQLDVFFYRWGSIPACLSDRLGFDPDVRQSTLTALCDPERTVASPFTSMFLHGGWLHLIGNMVFLWVFGDNVEDAMGHVRYAFFYVIVGLAATAAHTAIDPSDVTPAIGASGAISGVLAAYLVLYPRASVTAILPIFIVFWVPFHVPAVFLIGLWFVMQLVNGVVSLNAHAVGAGGGVAWFAHIGGFAAGLLLVKLFMIGRTAPPAPSRAGSYRRQAG